MLITKTLDELSEMDVLLIEELIIIGLILHDEKTKIISKDDATIDVSEKFIITGNGLVEILPCQFHHRYLTLLNQAFFC